MQLLVRLIWSQKFGFMLRFKKNFKGASQCFQTVQISFQFSGIPEKLSRNTTWAELYTQMMNQLFRCGSSSYKEQHVVEDPPLHFYSWTQWRHQKSLLVAGLWQQNEHFVPLSRLLRNDCVRKWAHCLIRTWGRLPDRLFWTVSRARKGKCHFQTAELASVKVGSRECKQRRQSALLHLWALWVSVCVLLCARLIAHFCMFASAHSCDCRGGRPPLGRVYIVRSQSRSLTRARARPR